MPQTYHTPSFEEKVEQRVYDGVKSIVIKTAERGAIAALFGIGIASVVARSKIPKQQQEYDVPNELNTPGYDPDASPDGKGGYKATSRWDGYMSSALSGMPVMCYIKFVGGTYIDLQGNQQTIPDVTLENVLISVSPAKVITKEQIPGRDSGTVKEYIGKGDWTVTLRTIITADAPVNSTVQKRIQNGVYPRDNMRELMRLFDAPIALPVECWYLQQFGINYLVIDESGTQIEQGEGEYSFQKMTLQLISDNPLVITIAD